MSPTRRELIASASVLSLGALAGCTGGPGGSGPSTDETTTDETTTDETTTDETTTTEESEDLPGTDGNESGGTRPEGTGGPGLSMRGTDDAPDLPVVPSVEITEDTATAEHPPQVRVTVTNESDGTVSVGEGRAIVFAYVRDTSGELIFLPADGEYPADADCWRLKEPIAVTMEYQVVELEADESVSRTVALYGAADGEGCLPVGEFRFETDYSVGTGAEGVPTDGETETWGFSVALE